MKKLSKRLVSIFLTAVMVLGMVLEMPGLTLEVKAQDGEPALIQSGTGASDGVVYGLTRKTSGFVEGTKYIFVSGGEKRPYLTIVPNGSGVLMAASTNKETRGWDAYITSSITAYVDVVRATDGFDTCRHGTLNYSASEYSCNAGGVQHQAGAAYTYTEYPYGSKVTVSLTKNGQPWNDQKVEIYRDGARLNEQKSVTDGVYDLGYKANGRYEIYVNGEAVGGITVNARPVYEEAPAPGTRNDDGFVYITDKIFSASYEYHTFNAKTVLNPDRTESVSTEPGEIMLLNNGLLFASGSGEVDKLFRGANNRSFSIQVGAKETGHSIGNRTNTEGESEQVNFYKMKVTINAERSFSDADVSLRNAKGELLYVLKYDSSLSSGNTAVFTTILQAEESSPGTEKSFESATAYSVYVNGQDTHKTVKRVGRSEEMEEGYYPCETSVDYYRASLTVKKDNSLWNEVSATLDNGVEHYAMIYNSSTQKYEADVLNNKNADGTERPYTISVEGGLDTSTPTRLTSTARTATYDYYTVNYWTYKKANANDTSYVLDTNKPWRTQIIRKGCKTTAPSDAYVDGLSFRWYSASEWSNGDASTEFNYAGVAINSTTNLYAQFAKPEVKIGEFVASTGPTFKLENLTISGFDRGDKAIKSVQIQTKNTSQVKFATTNGISAKQGTGQNLGSGNVATNNIINITFNNGLSMADAQTWLRTNLVFTPVTGKTCEVKITASDGIITNGSTDNPGQSQANVTATELTGSNNDLDSGYYYLTQNRSYSGGGDSGALRIGYGQTVTIYIPQGVTLTATGSNASGRTGAGAGIFVPYNSTLILVGKGTVNATGGNAAGGSNGTGNVADAYVKNLSEDWYHGGTGGDGGNGGGGAGAGIGGYGGTGGAGNTGAAGSSRRAYGNEPQNQNGSDGNPGGNGDKGKSGGTIIIGQGMNVSSRGGNADGLTGGAAGTWNTSESKIDNTNYRGTDGGSDWDDNYSAAAGGAGGGGGAGGPAFDFGGGGAGGGAGGAGGGGGTHHWAKSNGRKWLDGGGGGGGNSVVSGGRGGDGSGGSGYAAGGAGGAAGESTTAVEPTRNYTTGNNTKFTVEFGNVKTYEYNYGFGASITNIPDYSAPAGKYFLGWKVTTYGKYMGRTDGTQPLTSAETKLYQPGDSINITEGTYGNIVLSPITRQKIGICAEDVNSMNFPANYSVPTYYTYKLTTNLDGTATKEMGALILTNGNDKRTLAPDASGIYTMKIASNKTYAVTSSLYPEFGSLGSATASGTNANRTLNFTGMYVDVQGYDSALVTLKKTGTQTAGPKLARFSVSNEGKANSVASFRHIIYGTNTENYDIYIDGNPMSFYGGNQKAAYGAAKKAVITFCTDRINVTTNTKITQADLRELSGSSLKENGEILTLMQESDKVWFLRKLKSSTEYEIFINGVDTGIKTDFNSNHTANVSSGGSDIQASLYLLTVKTRLNGQAADVAAVTIGDETATRVAQGDYQLYVTSAGARAVKIGETTGANVSTSNTVAGSTITEDFYTVNYQNEEKSDESGRIYLPEKDPVIYHKGSRVNVLDDYGALPNGKAVYPDTKAETSTEATANNSYFIGWKSSQDGLVYTPESEVSSITSEITFTSMWSLFSTTEARWVINGRTQYGTLAEAFAAANDENTSAIDIYIQNPVTMTESATLPEHAKLTVEPAKTLYEKTTDPTTGEEKDSATVIGTTSGGHLQIANGAILSNYGTVTNDKDLTVKSGGILINKYVKGTGGSRTGANLINSGKGKITTEPASGSTPKGRIINEGIFRNGGDTDLAPGSFENEGDTDAEAPGGELSNGNDGGKPLGGFAEIENDEPVVIRLEADTDLKSPLVIDSSRFGGKKIVLDLHGYTLTGPADSESNSDLPAVRIEGTGTYLTIIDSVGGGSLRGGNGYKPDDNNGTKGNPGIEVVAGEVTIDSSAKIYGGTGGTGVGETNGGEGGLGAKLTGGKLIIEKGGLVQGGNGGDVIAAADESESPGAGGKGGTGVAGSGGKLDNHGESSPTYSDTPASGITIQPGKPGTSYKYTPPTVNPDGSVNDGSKSDGTPGEQGSGVGDGVEQDVPDERIVLMASKFTLDPGYVTYKEESATAVPQEPLISFKEAENSLIAVNGVDANLAAKPQSEEGTANPAVGDTKYVAAPVIAYNSSTKKVTLSTSSVAGVEETIKIYYTVNGADPTSSDTEYTGSEGFEVSSASTIKAVAIRTNGGSVLGTSAISVRECGLPGIDKIGAVTIKYYKEGTDGGLTEVTSNNCKPAEVGSYIVKISTSGSETLTSEGYLPATLLTIGTFTIVPASQENPITIDPGTGGEPTIGPLPGNDDVKDKTYVVTVNNDSDGKVTTTIDNDSIDYKTYTIPADTETVSATVTGMVAAGFTPQWTVPGGSGITFAASESNTQQYSATFNVTQDTEIGVTAVPAGAHAPDITKITGATLTEGYTGTHNISVAATAATGEALTYQWYKGEVADANKLESATGAKYTLPAGGTDGLKVESGQEQTVYTYNCVVTSTRDDNGQTASVTVPVTVTILKPTTDTVPESGQPSSTDSGINVPTIGYTGGVATITHTNTGTTTTSYDLYYIAITNSETEVSVPSVSEQNEVVAEGWTLAAPVESAGEGSYTSDVLTVTTTYRAFVAKKEVTETTTSYTLSRIVEHVCNVDKEEGNENPTLPQNPVYSDPVEVTAPTIAFSINPTDVNSATATITAADTVPDGYTRTTYYTVNGTTPTASNSTSFTGTSTQVSLDKYTHVKAVTILTKDAEVKSSTVTVKTFIPKDVVNIADQGSNTGKVTPLKPGKTSVTMKLPENPAEGEAQEDVVITFDVTEVDKEGGAEGEKELAMSTTYTVPYGFKGFSIAGATASSNTSVATVGTGDNAGKITTVAISELDTNNNPVVTNITNGTKTLAGLIVVKRPITIAPNNNNITYEQEEPFYTYTVEGGLAEGDVLSGVKITRAVGTGQGTYALSIAEADRANVQIKNGETDKKGNYDITYAEGKTLVVSKRKVIVSGIKAVSKYYDGTKKATLLTESGSETTLSGTRVVDSETGRVINHSVTIAEQNFEYASENIGTYRINLKDDNGYLYQSAGGNDEPVAGSQEYVETSILRYPLDSTRDDLKLTYGVTEQVYNGSNQFPETVTATDTNGNTRTLTRGVDYNINGAGYRNVGEYTVLINGQGNYTGSATVGFKILPRNIEESTIALAGGGNSLTYTGEVLTQSISSVTIANPALTLRDGTDYDITVVTQDMKDGGDIRQLDTPTNKADFAGNYSLTLQGKGNYTGTKTVTFTVNKANRISPSLAVEVVPAAEYMTYDGGNDLEQTFTVKIGGKTLAKNEFKIKNVSYTVGSGSSTTVDQPGGDGYTIKVKEIGTYTVVVEFTNYTPDYTANKVFKVTNGKPFSELKIRSNQTNNISVYDPDSSEDNDKKTILTAVTDVDNETDVSFIYQWYRDGEPIEGGTTKDHTLSALDVGHILKVEVTANGIKRSALTPEITAKPDDSVPEPEKHKVSGKVTKPKSDGENPEMEPVAGITIELRKGNLVYASTTTDSDGEYSFDNLPDGEYNVVAYVAYETDYVTKTELVELKGSDQEINIQMPYYKVSSKLNVYGDTPPVVVGGLDEAAEESLTYDEKTDGAKVTMTMTVQGKTDLTNVDDDQLSVANKQLKEDQVVIKEKAGMADPSEKEHIDFIDMSISRKVETNSSSTTTEVHSELHGVLEIIVPYSTENRRNFRIFRRHDTGRTEESTGKKIFDPVESFRQLNSRPTQAQSFTDATFFLGVDFFVIYSNKCSTYAVAYEDYTPGGGGGGGGGGTTPEPAYEPVITQPEHATITVNPASPKSGENATVTVTPEEGYETEDVIVKDKDGNTVPVTKNDDGTYTFTQPETGPVTIEAVIRQATDLTPVIKKPEHGTISANPAKPKAGETVIVTVTPDEGYEVDSFIVTDKEGKPVAFTLNEDGTYTFVQPATGCVTIEAVLKLKDGVVVRFDLNGKTGTEPDPQTFIKGGKAVRPNDPAAEGYTFTGWYTDKECTKLYDFDTPVEEDMILYAGWEKKEGPGPDDKDFGIYFTELFDDPYEGVHYNADYNNGKGRYEIVYTGAPIKPLIRVTSKADGMLKEGIDYTVSYSNNKNVSKPDKPATIRVNGRGFYKSKKVLELYILQADLEKANDKGLIAGVDELKVLNGNKLNPMIVYRGYKLAVRDRDISNKNKITGDTTTDITGKGNFTGVLKDVPVKVISKDDQKNGAIKVNLKAGKHIYNGEAHKLSVTTEKETGELTVTAGSSKIPLIEGTDFVVSYSSNAGAGKATVTITGIGKCNGTVVKNFTIQPDKTINITTELADPAPVNFNVRGAQPDIKVTAHRKAEDETVTDEVLVEGRDYKVSYSSNKKIGKGSYTVKFVGNYNGHKAVKGTFDIVQASIDTAKVEAIQMIYKNPGRYLSKPFVSIDGVQLKTSDYTYKYYIGEEEITSKYKLSLEDDETSKTVKIVVIGKGNYTNTTAEGTYEVVRRGNESIDLTKAKIVAKEKNKKGKDVNVAKQEYNGYAIEPEIRVMAKVNKKWVDVDPSLYSVSYINNVNKGTATILVSGNGTETIGSKTARFGINNMLFERFETIFRK